MKISDPDPRQLELREKVAALLERKDGPEARTKYEEELARTDAMRAEATLRRRRQRGERAPSPGAAPGAAAPLPDPPKPKPKPKNREERRQLSASRRRQLRRARDAALARHESRLRAARAPGVIPGLPAKPWPVHARRQARKVQDDAIERVRFLKCLPAPQRRALVVVAYQRTRKNGEPLTHPDGEPLMRPECSPAAIACLAFFAALYAASEESRKAGRWRSVAGFSRSVLAAAGPDNLLRGAPYSEDTLRGWLRRAEQRGLVERVQPPPSGSVHVGSSGWALGELFLWPPAGTGRNPAFPISYEVTSSVLYQEILAGLPFRSSGRGLRPPWISSGAPAELASPEPPSL